MASKLRLRELGQADVNRQCVEYLLRCGEVKTYFLTPEELEETRKRINRKRFSFSARQFLGKELRNDKIENESYHSKRCFRVRSENI